MEQRVRRGKAPLCSSAPFGPNRSQMQKIDTQAMEGIFQGNNIQNLKIHITMHTSKENAAS